MIRQIIFWKNPNSPQISKIFVWCWLSPFFIRKGSRWGVFSAPEPSTLDFQRFAPISSQKICCSWANVEITGHKSSWASDNQYYQPLYNHYYQLSQYYQPLYNHHNHYLTNIIHHKSPSGSRTAQWIPWIRPENMTNTTTTSTTTENVSEDGNGLRICPGGLWRNSMMGCWYADITMDHMMFFLDYAGIIWL